MNVNLSMGDILTIIGAVIPTVGTMLWGLLKALQKAQEASLKLKFDGLNEAVRAVSVENKQQNTMMHGLEKQFLELKVELNKDFVRREDFIRSVGSVDAKIDNMALRIERAVMSLGGKVQ